MKNDNYIDEIEPKIVDYLVNYYRKHNTQTIGTKEVTDILNLWLDCDVVDEILVHGIEDSYLTNAFECYSTIKNHLKQFSLNNPIKIDSPEFPQSVGSMVSAMISDLV